jgi:hypothetical protein
MGSHPIEEDRSMIAPGFDIIHPDEKAHRARPAT